jgi:hypothetical protein
MAAAGELRGWQACFFATAELRQVLRRPQ